MVGNGNNLKSNGLCPDLLFYLEETPFTIPFFVLPAEGADLVLGLSWLRTLGPILVDFSIPKITFNVVPKAITLRDETHTIALSNPQLKTLIHTYRVVSFHALYFQVEHTQNKDMILIHPNPTIQQILQQYGTVFDILKHLPTSRSQDHHIPTIPRATPVNVNPYMYPHYQKQVMKKMIIEMLEDGIIKPGQLPFSSPILLVKKEDGTWLFCVDYKP